VSEAGDGPRAASPRAATPRSGDDPDARIAERNVTRYEHSGRIDPCYLRLLSADAAPALARLPRPLAVRVTARMRAPLHRSDGVTGANLGRSRARAALAGLPIAGSGTPPECEVPGWR
jgi:hypothetical protein